MAYAAGDTLVRTIMHAASGLPQDDVVNDFAFKLAAGAPNAADYLALSGAVDGFYNDAHTGVAVGEHISLQIPRTTTHRIDMYHIQAGALGSPVFSIPWLGPVASTLGVSGLPTEVAGCLSFHADYTGVLEEAGATRPRARRRGRLYIGPLRSASCISNAPPYGLTDAFTLALREAANSMDDEADAAGWTWCVWSRTDAVLRQVVGGHTDNAPDTQRRRGFKATLRTTYTL